ncbi:hypothetical protein RclHR1_10970004 [Rhizophagus clarus]|uniref:Uncharacterized protein n=1 Tax=Rhizophagus clarus TaxID=94130 RepID=A0A2Z6Q2X8_9GLOM|nr:hypothetical protein RclHR1_10970004 [Rhizophagus clarus]GES84757.1 hypothetical protein RCL_jg24109.t1 [Rhizophagus clarus]
MDILVSFGRKILCILSDLFLESWGRFFLWLFGRDILTVGSSMASSLCRISIVDTHVEFDNNETVLTTQLLTANFQHL